VPDSQFLILKGEFSTKIYKKTGLKGRKGKGGNLKERKYLNQL